jgi:6-phosphogluconolactonase/glucosamine-6-phosphate isomerase/deaminase
MSGMTPRVVIDDLAQLQQTFATAFEAQAREVIARRGKFIVALPGGSVAPAFFPALATRAIDWTRVECFWIDERAVPPDHPDSNFALASRLLLVPARVPPGRIHRMHGELPDLDQAARRAADELKSIAGDPPHLDLALAGAGEDGHVASIFPSVSAGLSADLSAGLSADLSADLSAEARSAKVEARSAKVEARSAKVEARSAKADSVFAVYDSPKPPARRLTLALSVLAGAGLVVVAAFGASKAAVMRRALDESDRSTPVARLLRSASSSLVLLDRAAGAGGSRVP